MTDTICDTIVITVELVVTLLLTAFGIWLLINIDYSCMNIYMLVALIVFIFDLILVLLTIETIKLANYKTYTK